jgi:threonine/homoserine/homoserine lactone efflux protein
VIPYLALGVGFGFAAAIQPGPLQAFLLARVTANGWRQTLPASIAPLLSDIPIALVVLLALSRVTITAQEILRFTGGLFLLYLAWSTIREAEQASGSSTTSTAGSAPRTVLHAALVNILNPNPYLGWTLVLGPAVREAWRQQPIWSIALVSGFYGTMVVILGVFIYLAGAARLLQPSYQRRLIQVSGLFLAFLGLYQIFVSIERLRAA